MTHTHMTKINQTSNHEITATF